MRRQLVAGVLAMGLLAGASLAQEPPPLVELETVLVIGEQPGPGLWKVSKGEHVMWVLASHGPLPKGMIWRSQKIEARIAESQEVLYPGGVSVVPDIGLLRGLTLIPAALKAGKMPDGKTLKDVVSPETYTKWLVLRQQYMGKDDDAEKWRPAIALSSLRNAALGKNNLQDGPSVDAVVNRAAKKHKVRIHRLPVERRTVKVEDPRAMLKSAQKLDLPDVECFTKGLDQVEPGVERLKQLANAWSRGNIEKLRVLYRDRQANEPLKDNCAYVLMMAFNEGDSAAAARAKKLIADIQWHVEQSVVQARQDWLAAAQTALAKNRTTFAVLPVADVIGSTGHLAKLRDLGYTVEEPL